MKSSRAKWVDRAWWLPALPSLVPRKGDCVYLTTFIRARQRPSFVQLHAHRCRVCSILSLDFGLLYLCATVGRYETRWTGLLRRGGCLLLSLVSRKGGIRVPDYLYHLSSAVPLVCATAIMYSNCQFRQTQLTVIYSDVRIAVITMILRCNYMGYLLNL